MKKYLCKIPLQFFGDDPAPSDPTPSVPPQEDDALAKVVAAYELKLSEITKERDLAQAQNVEYKKAIDSILNGRAPHPEAPDAAAFAKSCKF